jgi:hypothetical protein
LKNDLERWRQINEVKLPELNKALQQSKLAPLPSVAVDKEPTCPN